MGTRRTGGRKRGRGKPDKEDFEASEARTREFLLDQANRAIEQRSKDREFHGLEREFRYHQAQMLLDFEKTKDVKHRRDLCATREQILRRFLTTSGYLPKRYEVSNRSIRVASATGHLSREIDIALYDPQDSLTLMDREDVYQVLPLESVYGVIQVKSRLNRTELQDGLTNLASFKVLERPPIIRPLITSSVSSDRGFAILFAYDSDLKWGDIIDELSQFANSHNSRQWTNAIFIVNKGFFLHGQANLAAFYNSEIEAIHSLQMHGRPDRDGLCLFQFQSVLLALLRNTHTRPAELDPYFRLPLIADEHSYTFSLGPFAEIGRCEKHGDFARRIEAGQLEKVVQWCRSSKPINWVRANHIAFEVPEDEAAYARQPGDVYIYNPQNLPLKDILTRPAEFGDKTVPVISYDMIQSAGMNIWIPLYYSLLEGIVSGCPKCPKLVVPEEVIWHVLFSPPA